MTAGIWDGRDLAAALQTIVEVGDPAALQMHVADAFPGSRLEIAEAAGRFDVLLHAHGLLRPLSAAELSDRVRRDRRRSWSRERWRSG